MRPLELTLILLGFGAVMLLFVRPSVRPVLLIGITVGLTLLLGFHLYLEQYRWQMLPIYVAILMLVMIVILGITSDEPLIRKSFWRIVYSIFFILLLISGTFLSLALPITKLPLPSGPYPVGTTTLYMVDENREETYTDDTNDIRELMVQLWYPIDEQDVDEGAEYIQKLDVAGPALARRLNLPDFLLDHLELIRTNSTLDASILLRDEPYPVLLFSHGLMGIRMQNSFQMEELASHGYVVASPDHTYDSVLTVMPDGRVLFHEGDALFPDQISRIDAGQELVNVRKEDLRFIMNNLEEMNVDPGGILFNTLDLDRIGLVGHSTGGGTILETCFDDVRCKAAVALDSWVQAISDQNQSLQLPVPSLLINSEEWLGSENQDLGRTLAMNAKEISYEVTIEDAHHNNFTDIPLLSPLTPFFNLSGPVDGRSVHEIINDLSVSFFDQYLRGLPADLSRSIESTDPEVHLIVYEP